MPRSVVAIYFPCAVNFDVSVPPETVGIGSTARAEAEGKLCRRMEAATVSKSMTGS